MLRVGFIGAGKMAEALIRAILTLDEEIEVIASDVVEERRRLMSAIEGVVATDDNRKVAAEANIIFLAVKPQNMDALLEEIHDADKLVVSIAAGISIERMEAVLTGARVIRIMPNTPCLVGEMAGGFALGSRATQQDAERVLGLLRNAGRIYQMDETHLDAVTALSGSGPAFVAYMIKAMANGAVKQGLPPDVALQLAVQTVLGTGKLMRDMSLSPEALIAMVSSPGGTTVAGRGVLESSDMMDVLEKTISAATERSRELARGAGM